MDLSGYDLRAYGLNMEAEEFCTVAFLEFSRRYIISVEDLLFQPKEARNFCNWFRHEYDCKGLPDELILRAAMHRRNNPLDASTWIKPND